MVWIAVDPIVAWILRAAFAALFAAAAAHKLRDPRAFQQTLSDYQILPRVLVMPVSIGLVSAEVLIVIGLVSGIGDSLVGVSAALLLLLYTIAIGINLLRGRTEIDCGCLGPAGRVRLSKWLLARNGILAVGASLTSLPVSGRALHGMDGITLLGGFTLLLLLFNAINLLASQGQRRPEAETI
jgi:hypothetical protein